MTFFCLARCGPIGAIGGFVLVGGRIEEGRGVQVRLEGDALARVEVLEVGVGGQRRLLATAALRPLLDDRRLVRLVAGVVVLDLAPDDQRAAERLDPGAYPLGDLVQRDADHDEQTEAEQQDQQRHGHVRGEQVGQQAGRQVAGDAAGLAQRGRVVGPRQAVGDVDQSEQTEGDGCPADELATARTVALGMPQRPPGHQQQQQRCRVREGADQGGDADVDRVAHGAGQAEPELGGDDDGAADQEQTHPVAAQGRIEVAGAGADGAGGGADQVSQAEPEGEPVPHRSGPAETVGAACCAPGRSRSGRSRSETSPISTNPSARPAPGTVSSWPALGSRCPSAHSSRPAGRRSVRAYWTWSCFRTTAAANQHPWRCWLWLATAVGKTRGSPWEGAYGIASSVTCVTRRFLSDG